MPEFRLKVFYSVAKNLSFTKASNELFITQPAITKHIQALEKEYGLPLFIRKGSKISLTQAGKELLKYSENVFSLHRRFEEEISQLKGENRGSLKIGASTTIAQYVLPPVLSSFHNKYPNVTLSLINGNSEQIAEALTKGEIDLGLVEGKIKSRDIKYRLFMKDELVAAISLEQKRNLPNEISLAQLKKLPLILRERGSGTLEVLEYALRSKKIKLSDLNVIMYLGSTEAIKYYLESDNSIGFLSIRSIKKELESGALKTIKIKGLKVARTFDFICLQGTTPSSLASLFIKFSKKHYNQK